MIWQIDIEKSLGGERWTNVYFSNAASLAAAANVGTTIVNSEKLLHMNVVNFSQMRVRPYPALGAQGTVYQLGGTGSVTAFDYLPLFAVGRVTLTVAAGRPSRKYYRMPIREDEQANGIFIASKVTSVNTTLGQMIQIAGLTDESGNAFVSATLVPEVGMRQLRRGSKRRATNVL